MQNRYFPLKNLIYIYLKKNQNRQRMNDDKKTTEMK